MVAGVKSQGCRHDRRCTVTPPQYCTSTSAVMFVGLQFPLSAAETFRLVLNAEN